MAGGTAGAVTNGGIRIARTVGMTAKAAAAQQVIQQFQFGLRGVVFRRLQEAGQIVFGAERFSGKIGAVVQSKMQ